MKRIVATVLLVSMSAMAEKAAKIEEPPEAKLEDNGVHKNWLPLNDWADSNKLKEGTLSAEILLGYEYSDVSGNGTRAAHALLTRTRVNYQTANYEGFDARIQAQYVGPINDHYGPGNPNYDVVADPEAFRLHQAYLAYTGYDSHARVGAQEIILDNERLIGNIGWRLNAQSFNAGSIQNESVENLKLYYAYADSINGINGLINHNRQYHMLNAEYQLDESNQVSAYAYLQRNDGAGTLDKLDTYGLRAWGKNEKISHDAMVALQDDAYYGSVFAAVNVGVDVGVGIEFISGGNDLNERFQTLNGTAHEFNGWADQFLGTGGGLNGGLIDFYGQVSGMFCEKLKLMGAFHYFNTADATNPGGGATGGFQGDYGHEIDLLAQYPVCANLDVTAKLAYYKKGDNHPDNFTADETVFWLRGTLSF